MKFFDSTSRSDAGGKYKFCGDINNASSCRYFIRLNCKDCIFAAYNAGFRAEYFDYLKEKEKERKKEMRNDIPEIKQGMFVLLSEAVCAPVGNDFISTKWGYAFEDNHITPIFYGGYEQVMLGNSEFPVSKHGLIDSIFVRRECSSETRTPLVSLIRHFACSDKVIDSLFELVWKKENTKEMTISEIEKELGHSVKIVKEK